MDRKKDRIFPTGGYCLARIILIICSNPLISFNYIHHLGFLLDGHLRLHEEGKEFCLFDHFAKLFSSSKKCHRFRVISSRVSARCVCRQTGTRRRRNLSIEVLFISQNNTNTVFLSINIEVLESSFDLVIRTASA